MCTRSVCVCLRTRSCRGSRLWSIRKLSSMYSSTGSYLAAERRIGITCLTGVYKLVYICGLDCTQYAPPIAHISAFAPLEYPFFSSLIYFSTVHEQNGSWLRGERGEVSLILGLRIRSYHLMSSPKWSRNFFSSGAGPKRKETSTSSLVSKTGGKLWNATFASWVWRSASLSNLSSIDISLFQQPSLGASTATYRNRVLALERYYFEGSLGASPIANHEGLCPAPVVRQYLNRKHIQQF